MALAEGEEKAALARWKEVESLTRFSAVALGFLYASGFLIVTLHHAGMGISDFNLLKPRVLSAGLFFALLTAVPCVAAARSLGLWGFAAAYALKDNKSRSEKFLIALEMYSVCYVLAWFSVGLFEPMDLPTGWHTWVALVVAAAAAASARMFTSRPAIHLACSVIGTLAIVGALLYDGHFLFASRTAWFYACSVSLLWVSSRASRAGKLREVEWERNFMIPIALLAFFAIQIYGTGRPQFGGGAPVRVTVYLNSDVPALFGPSPVSSWLVEQNDQGFYLLRSRDDKRAVFIGRSYVKALVFDPDRSTGNTGK